MEFHDFSRRPDPRRTLDDRSSEKCRIRFDISKRLFYFALVKLAELEHACVLVLHQVISDAWSFRLSGHYLGDFYGRSLGGALREPLPLPRFSAFVDHEKQDRRTAGYRRAKEYWRQKLVEDPESIPFYSRDAGERANRVERRTLELGDRRSLAIQALAAGDLFSGPSLHFSRFLVFATVVFTYLYRVSGSRLLSVGTPIPNRPSKEFKETLGPLMHTYPIRLRISHQESFVSLARKIKEEMREAIRHRRYAVGNSSHRLLYDVILGYETVWIHRFSGMPVQLRWADPGHAAETLGIWVREEAQTGNFSLDFAFRCDRFDGLQRDQTCDHFLRVLDSLLRKPEQSLSGVSLLSPEETARVLGELSVGEDPSWEPL
jgi:hypothetical protein